ncbi:hypothetical protein [Cellulomonas xylanilytica]|uniref:Uncharacterized protein n=1 Tax=Cellulomonas xylanilytica TaxID=233583 RepID=A0A510V7D3_9CELL|nr:hypothetical protein [Cellulomonas xylanilytica]GEK21851.1 hypothetical protein CXY01_23710 [Cellulomonas xylanilytica]
MTSTRTRALRGATVALVALGLAASAAPAQATPDVATPDSTMALPAGLACTFPVTVTGTGGFRHEHTKGPVTTTTGLGQNLTVTNDASGDSIRLRSSGATSVTTTLPDGSKHVVLLGANLVILFPTDIPAGPSMTLYKGRVEYTVDAAETWTIVSTSGRATDLCEALS